MSKPTRLDYCQYLLSSQINYTLTNFANHTQQFSHDQLTRLLRQNKWTPRLIWEQVKDKVPLHENGFIIFDDSIFDKDHSHKIELVRRQYSGNAHRLIKGISVVNCLYVNPTTQEYWLIDFRIYAPESDGQSKLDHVRSMFDHLVHSKKLPFSTVLVDSWYATKSLMLHFERNGKIFYCPLQSNRNVDEGDGSPSKYQRVDALSWTEEELDHGKSVHLKGFPKGHRLQLFRLVISTNRTDYVVTNDKTQSSATATQQVCRCRWKIEQMHRESKQLTGLEECQSRNARAQRNHIACALLVWCRLKEIAVETSRSLYQVKYAQLSEYLIAQLRNPAVVMKFA